MRIQRVECIGQYALERLWRASNRLTPRLGQREIDNALVLDGALALKQPASMQAFDEVAGGRLVHSHRMRQLGHSDSRSALNFRKHPQLRAADARSLLNPLEVDFGRAKDQSELTEHIHRQRAARLRSATAPAASRLTCRFGICTFDHRCLSNDRPRFQSDVNAKSGVYAKASWPDHAIG